MYVDNQIIASCLIGFGSGCFVAWFLASLLSRWLFNSLMGFIIVIFIAIGLFSENGFSYIAEIILNLSNFLWDFDLYGVISFIAGFIIILAARRQRSVRREDDRHQERMLRRDRPNAIL